MSSTLADWQGHSTRPRPTPLPNSYAFSGQTSLDLALRMFHRDVEAGIVVTRTGEPYSSTYADNLRQNLLLGRFKLYREQLGIRTLDDLTPQAALTFLDGLRGRVARTYLTKIQQHLGLFGKWLADGPLHKTDLVGLPAVAPSSVWELTTAEESRVSVSDRPPLTRLQAIHLFEEAERRESKSREARKREPAPSRDRLLVMLLLLTGMRPSEAVALTYDSSIQLGRSPKVTIRGSWHNPRRTKSLSGRRDIPLNLGNMGLPQAMEEYLAWREKQRTTHTALFLAERTKAGDMTGEPQPLTLNGLKKMLQHLQTATGIPCNAYQLRHTFCTWVADKGVPEMQLAGWLGHKDTSLIHVYYLRKGNEAAIEAANRIRF